MSEPTRDPLVRFVRIALDGVDGGDPDAITTREEAESTLRFGGSNDASVRGGVAGRTAGKLLAGLESEDEAVRRRAAVVLAGASPSITRHWSSAYDWPAVGTRLLSSLDDGDEVVRRSVRAAIAHYEIDDDRLTELLTSSDPSDRERGLRAAGTRTDPSPAVFEAILDALGEADSSVRSRAATGLWYPPDELRFVSPLLDLVDAEEPAVRAGALSGVASLLSDGNERIDQERERVVELLPEIATAVTDTLRDPESVVRQRAITVWKDDLRRTVDEVASSNLSFDDRWSLATALAAAEADGDPLVADRARYAAPDAVENAYSGEPEAIPQIAAFAWERDLPAVAEAREVIADAAADHPELVTDEVRRVIDAFERADATPADARILATLADHDPDRVAEAVPSLEAALEGGEARRRERARGYPVYYDEGDLRRESARALDAIAAVRPNAVSVTREELVEATADVFVDGGIRPNRLELLADVSPDSAAGTLATACREGDRGYWLGRAIEEIGDTHPTVVADALGEIADALPSLDTRAVEPVAAGIERAVAVNPAAGAEHATALATGLGALESDARAAFARALHAIGTYDPDALADPVRPLLDHDPGSAEESSSWPLGVVARSAPEFAFEVASDRFSEYDYRGTHGERALAELLTELAAGDGAIAERAVSAMSDRFGDDGRFGSAVGVVARLADERPDVAAGAIVAVVAHLAADEWSPYEIDAGETMLENVASERPDAVRAAVRQHFGAPASFVEHAATRDRTKRETIVREAFDD